MFISEIARKVKVVVEVQTDLCLLDQRALGGCFVQSLVWLVVVSALGDFLVGHNDILYLAQAVVHVACMLLHSFEYNCPEYQTDLMRGENRVGLAQRLPRPSPTAAYTFRRQRARQHRCRVGPSPTRPDCHRIAAVRPACVAAARKMILGDRLGHLFTP